MARDGILTLENAKDTVGWIMIGIGASVALQNAGDLSAGYVQALTGLFGMGVALFVGGVAFLVFTRNWDI